MNGEDLESKVIRKNSRVQRNNRAIIILSGVVLGLIIILVVTKFTGVRQGTELAVNNVPRTASEIISELEGVQLVIGNYQKENSKYPIKVVVVKVFDMRGEVSGLAGYDEERLKGADQKDFLYQSDALGSIYVIFATLPEGSKEIKTSAPSGFGMPAGYNFWVSSEKAKTK
jgi:hypothetical protein